MKNTHIMLIAFLFAIDLPVFGQNQFWKSVQEHDFDQRSEKRWIVPAKYKTFELDVVSMEDYLTDVPLRFNENQSTKSIELPMPDGSFQQFAITEAPIMHPRLASKYPMIRCFVGRGIDDAKAVVYLDMTQQGFHGMIKKDGQAIFIDPYFADEKTAYIVYNKTDFLRENMELISCGNNDDFNDLLPNENAYTNNDRMTGVTLRSYDIAVAAAAEYTQFHGGTVPNALAAIVTAINRVRGIYETEMAITFQLVADNDMIIYTGADPYSQPPTLAENQTNIDLVIGSSNYDIGHVLSIGYGGIATVASTCVSNFKARGMTALDTPSGDPFYVDFLCHEIGHQLGAHHTFNGNEYNCGTAGTSLSSAFEPGSGSTIMAYAGTCGSQNLQINSHAYFHRRSLDEITSFVTTGDGNSCPTNTTTSNNAPIIDADPNSMDGKYIPRNTPFELTASGTDPDFDELTFAWEQMDLGAAGAPSSSAPGPILRSFPPTASPTRTFPALNALIDNTTNYGEYLPSVSRTLKFKATARDNQLDGGGNAADSITLNVTNTAGPFQITNLNTSAVVSGAILVQWNVANTNNAPINCSNVDLLLSVDGGQTYSALLENTPNDGSEIITLPNTTSGQARIKIKCADNVFFDINNADLRIAPSDASCSEKVVSGNFSSPTGWDEFSTNFGYVIDNWGIYHVADGSAWLGYANNEVSSISQSVSIPAGAHFANLEFWYKLEAADCGNDVFRVYLDGAIVKTYTLCNDPASGNWVRQLINLSGKIGQTFEIKFELINNSNTPTDLLIDDVSVFTCENGSFAPLPIELMKFEAKGIENTAKLHWITASESNNRGFKVEMQTEDGAFQPIGFVSGNGTTNEMSTYNFEVPELKPGIYYFRLRQMDENGAENISPIRSVLIAGDSYIEVSPNPVADIAFFKVSLEKPSHIELQIMDGLGRVIGTVADNSYSAGNFEFAFNTNSLPAGVYFYRMLSANLEETGKLVISK